MARKIKDQAAIRPAQGKKLTFDDDSDIDIDEQDVSHAGPSTAPAHRARQQQSDYSDYDKSDEDEDDDDDAPEAVGVSAAKQSVQDAEAERVRYVTRFITPLPCLWEPSSQKFSISGVHSHTDLLARYRKRGKRQPPDQRP